MRAAAYTAFGDPGTVETLTRPKPEPGPAEAVVRVEACSLNHRDLWKLEGKGLSEDELPYVGGSDVAGVVDAVGADVNAVDVDERVVLSPNLTCGDCRFCRDSTENRCVEYGIYDGGFAEYCTVDASRLIALPSSVDVVSGAALPISYMTVYHMLRRGEVSPGDLVFVPGATGGVGVAAVQLLDLLGARSIVTSSSAEKLRRLDELGATHTIQASEPAAIRSQLEAYDSPDVVLNHLGGPYTAVGLDALGRTGRMVVCGRTVDRRSEIDIRDLYWEHKRVVGSTMGTHRDLERLVALVADGSFEPVVGETYPLDELADAFAALRDRSAFGKQVIQPQR